MPPRWFHDGIDIIVFGRSHWRLHVEKDAPWLELGPSHRQQHHEWYSQFDVDWTHDDPFPEGLREHTRYLQRSLGPEVAERLQVWITHDYIDRVWDDIDRKSRHRVAGALRTLLLDVEVLRDWADVDVIRGLAKVTYRQEAGHEQPTQRWEPVPGLQRDYANLRHYLESRTINQLLFRPDKPQEASP